VVLPIVLPTDERNPASLYSKLSCPISPPLFRRLTSVWEKIALRWRKVLLRRVLLLKRQRSRVFSIPLFNKRRDAETLSPSFLHSYFIKKKILIEERYGSF